MKGVIKITTFSERLIKYRKNKNMTKADMARELKIPYTTYRNYEDGREPKLETIRQIADILDIPVNFLLYDFNTHKPCDSVTDKYYEQSLKERNIFDIVCKLRDLGFDYSTNLDEESSQGLIIINTISTIPVTDQELIELEKQTDDYFKLKLQELVVNKKGGFLFFFDLDKDQDK